MSTAEWRPDPEGQYEYRWWDGQQWTDQVAHQGQVGMVPLGQQQAVAVIGPEALLATPTGQVASGFEGISGDLVDGRYSENEATAIANQNAKMLRVRVGEPFMAQQGSMVAYQGNMTFAFEGGGASRFIKKALTGEGLPLMQVQGQGDVFLANLANDVHLLTLTNTGLSISGKNVLAFSASLDWNIERVKGGSIATGGLFNTTLRGSGWVAITTDGPPVVLKVDQAPTFADTQAVVAWSANLQTQLKASFTAGSLIGRGSGEAFQVAFQGQGFVIVQPSEGIQIPTAG
ncbi:MAG: AIM24 family protein [Euzebya sp.]